MKAYRILHKPTGLYYKPKSTPWDGHLSKKGKLYTTKPDIKTKIGSCVDLPDSVSPSQTVIKIVIETMGEAAIKYFGKTKTSKRYLETDPSHWQLEEI